MLEWLKRHAWKACSRLKRLTGSNPVLSAKEIQRKSQARLNFFSVSLLHRPAAGGAGCASSASKSFGKNGIAGRRSGMCELREQIPRKERDCGQAERDVRALRANPSERAGLRAGGAGCASSASKSLGKNGIAPERSDCAKDSGLPIHIGRPPCNSNLKLNL